MKEIAKKKINHPKKRWNLKMKYIVFAMTLALVPLLISYGIFIQDKIEDHQNYIKESLKEVSNQIAANDMIQEKLFSGSNDGSIQIYAEELLGYLGNVDIIVIADQSGKKYSHLDTNQIGQIFEGEDKEQVLKYGRSYYSLKEGSQGVTLRYFRPIFKEDLQVGFVMVGKYQSQITALKGNILKQYMMLFGGVLLITFLLATYFADRFKKIILDMEPEEIAALYLQKDYLLNSVQEGIILLDRNHEIQEANEQAKELLEEVSNEVILESLHKFLKARQAIRMQEFILGKKKLLITVRPLLKDKLYLGAVITLMDKEEVHEVAKEMLGIEEKNKNLRATVHEFKNNLHVLLGLLQLEEYKEAKQYILEIQQTKSHRCQQFASIKDGHLKAMLTSRSITASEKKVQMILEPTAQLMEHHGYIDKDDLITIMGNLIENAIEACSMSHKKEKWVKINLEEDEHRINIQVTDNGVPVEKDLKDCLFDLGMSTKGEGRGTGLYLLKKRLEVYRGYISMREEKGEKTFLVSIPKK